MRNHFVLFPDQAVSNFPFSLPPAQLSSEDRSHQSQSDGQALLRELSEGERSAIKQKIEEGTLLIGTSV